MTNRESVYRQNVRFDEYLRFLSTGYYIQLGMKTEKLQKRTINIMVLVRVEQKWSFYIYVMSMLYLNVYILGVNTMTSLFTLNVCFHTHLTRFPLKPAVFV